MGFDAISRQYQFAFFGGAVAVAAYFQASGIGSLIAGHLVPNEAPSIAAGNTSGSNAHLPVKSGDEVLARNPFDSVTGPLDGSAVVESDEEEDESPAASNGDPYSDPPCSGIRASLITATDDPAWSFASLSNNGDESLRRIGDKVGSLTVQHIGYYKTDDPFVTPHVWLVDGAARCLVEMGAAEPTSKKASPVAEKKPKKVSKKQKILNEVKSKIKKVGENQYEVDKSGVELIIQHYAKLAGSLRGKATKDGMQLKGIKDGSILGELGMQNGDMLKSINGFDMSDPDKAVDAYAKLRRAGKLDLAFSRDGATQNVSVAIK